MENKLKEAVLKSREYLPEPRFPDPNLSDIVEFARGLLDFTTLPLPQDMPNIRKGAQIAECVESAIFGNTPDHIMRNIPEEDLVERCRKLSKTLTVKNLLNFGHFTSLKNHLNSAIFAITRLEFEL